MLSAQSFDGFHQPSAAGRARVRNYQQPSFLPRHHHQDWRSSPWNGSPGNCHLPRNLRCERGNRCSRWHFYPLRIYLSGMWSWRHVRIRCQLYSVPRQSKNPTRVGQMDTSNVSRVSSMMRALGTHKLSGTASTLSSK